MKKLIALVFAGLFVLALAACNGDTPAQTTTNPAQTSSPAAQGIYFAPKGVKMEMGAAPAPVLEALGEPKNTLESPSCAIPDAMDTDYTYPGFKLTVTQPEEGEPYIANIKVLDDTYTVPGGVTIGSTPEEVFAAWGGGYEESNGFYKYTQGLSTLEFSIVDGKVAQILYGFIFD